MPVRLLLTLTLLLALQFPALATGKPTLWIIGDSTVKNNTRNQQGWGTPLKSLFDPEKITVENHAIGGRSSRSFLTEGRWDAILTKVHPGDFVLIQFGHNDGGEYFTGNRPRASIKGTGEETKSGTVETTGQQETIHSFGWYLRHYCATATAKGATPIVLSLIPRNRRDPSGHIIRDDKSYALWAQQAAAQSTAHFIPFNAILAARYDELGPAATDALFDRPDHTHTSPAGATFNARTLAAAIRNLHDCPLGSYLLSATP